MFAAGGVCGLDIKVDDLLANIRKSVDTDIDALTNGTTTQTRGTLMRGALREMRVNLGTDPGQADKVETEISDLRSRIRQKMAAMEADPFAQSARSVSPAATQARAQPVRAQTAIVPTRNDFSGILSRPAPAPSPPPLRGGYAAQDDVEELRYAEPEQQWEEPRHELYAQQPDPFGQQGYDPQYGYDAQAYAQPYPPQLEAPIMSAHTEAHAETAFRQLSDAILSRATGDRSLEEMTREMLRGMLKQWLDANLPVIVEDMVREEIQRVARRGR